MTVPDYGTQNFKFYWPYLSGKGAQAENGLYLYSVYNCFCRSSCPDFDANSPQISAGEGLREVAHYLQTAASRVLDEGEEYLDQPERDELEQASKLLEDALARYNEAILRIPDEEQRKVLYESSRQLLTATLRIVKSSHLSPGAEKYARKTSYRENGAKGSVKAEEKRSWVKPAELLMKELRQKNPTLSQSALATRMHAKLVNMGLEDVPQHKALVERIRKAEKAGTLPRRV